MHEEDNHDEQRPLIIAVGGVDSTNAHKWLAAGADGVGIGSAIYRPGWGAEKVYDLTIRLQKSLDLHSNSND